MNWMEELAMNSPEILIDWYCEKCKVTNVMEVKANYWIGNILVAIHGMHKMESPECDGTPRLGMLPLDIRKPLHKVYYNHDGVRHGAVVRGIDAKDAKKYLQTLLKNVDIMVEVEDMMVVTHHRGDFIYMDDK